eukprot:scaffold17806_cov20-Prasinocladus_malaysianus.AAC.1
MIRPSNILLVAALRNKLSIVTPCMDEHQLDSSNPRARCVRWKVSDDVTVGAYGHVTPIHCLSDDDRWNDYLLKALSCIPWKTLGVSYHYGARASSCELDRQHLSLSYGRRINPS